MPDERRDMDANVTDMAAEYVRQIELPPGAPWFISGAAASWLHTISEHHGTRYGGSRDLTPYRAALWTVEHGEMPSKDDLYSDNTTDQPLSDGEVPS